MPPVVAAAAIAGGASVATGVIGSRSQSGATRRSLEAQRAGAQRAEAFEREQDELTRADQARRDAEDRRRWETEQANLARQQSERDQRQAYEDELRYRKMVNIATLTGQPIPDRPPAFAGGAGPTTTTTTADRRVPLAAIATPPSRANAMIAPLGAGPALSDTNDALTRLPIRSLAARRY